MDKPEQAEGDYHWSQSGCSPPRPDVEWYGIPGSGSYLRTDRFGTYWVGGGVYQRFASEGYECGRLGPPVKEYQWLSEFSAWGQWFEFGAIYYRNGFWHVAIGNYGQTTGRIFGEGQPVPEGTEVPPDAPGEPPPLPE